MKGSKITRLLAMTMVAGFLFGSLTAFAQGDIRSKIKLVVDKNPDIKKIGVYFNKDQVSADQIPNLVGSAAIIKVPLASLRDVSQALNQVLNNYEIQAVFLVDDGKKLVTNSRTVKYFVKMGLKKNFMTFSDAETLDVKVSGRIAMRDGKLGLELADDQ
ncbi:hypothetical protein [Acanthopleuribacter pedis]|uniref:Uncharacterized protein n=1 Tax=Acanthopleuribacter pedis TaxID=442870 RepID=A0A8J7U1V5_9BACT|nr:hypothetical protein [Acanthopleuribacter pedis]MBO1317927.1 hypothetical protein [Acanthopleuribacter pedis]